MSKTEFTFNFNAKVHEREGDIPQIEWKITAGEHKVRCTDYDFVPEHEELDYVGNPYIKRAQHEIKLRDIKTGEEITTYIADTPSAVEFLGKTINRQTRGDLVIKINQWIKQGKIKDPKSVGALEYCTYMAQYPISIWYEQEAYVDRLTGEDRMSKPKVMWYNPGAGKVEKKPSKSHVHFSF